MHPARREATAGSIAAGYRSGPGIRPTRRRPSPRPAAGRRFRPRPRAGPSGTHSRPARSASRETNDAVVARQPRGRHLQPQLTMRPSATSCSIWRGNARPRTSLSMTMLRARYGVSTRISVSPRRQGCPPAPSCRPCRSGPAAASGRTVIASGNRPMSCQRHVFPGRQRMSRAAIEDRGMLRQRLDDQTFVVVARLVSTIATSSSSFSSRR